MTNIRPLDQKLQAKAIAELNEVPSRLHEDIATLRTWIEKQPHLKARTDDQFLVTFLRGCKFSFEMAKEKIDKYYSMRTAYEDLLICRNVTDPRVKKIFSLGFGLILPEPLGEDGPRIIIIRAGNYSTERFSLSEVIQVNSAIQDVLLNEDDNIVISGYVQIVDFSSTTSSHFFQMNPPLMRKFSTYAEEALPMRHVGTHLINTPSGFGTIFSAIKPFLPLRIQQTVYVHGSNLDSLYKIVPQKYLPVEYGGENGSVPEVISYWTKNIQAHAEFLKNNAQYRANEDLRVGKPMNFENVFGAEGSFRKLNLD